jgi:hypothetical protein
MTLPELKVGQIWLSRNQQWRIHITRIDTYVQSQSSAISAVLKHEMSESTRTSDHRFGMRHDHVRNGYYYFPHTDSYFDFNNLIYDPN